MRCYRIVGILACLLVSGIQAAQTFENVPKELREKVYKAVGLIYTGTRLGNKEQVQQWDTALANYRSDIAKYPAFEQYIDEWLDEIRAEDAESTAAEQ